MEYLLKSTAILSLFYLFYKIFLQNETFFELIRIYFLIGFISAIAIPLIVITKYIIVEPMDLSHLNFVKESTIISSPTFDWIKIIILIYLIGVAFFTLRYLTQLGSLLWYIKNQPKIKKGKYFMIVTNKNNAPFSFFNYIVFNPTHFKNSELEQIITHEKIHVNQLHSLDILLSHLALVLNWFNPFIWLYNKEIQKNLEFIADELTQNISQEKMKYQHLLLKTISPNYQMALTNNFYNSLIKKRINMLQKKRSNSTMHFKFALIIPILIAFVFTFNTKIIAQKNEDWTIKVGIDRVDFFEVITKDFSKTDFEKLKTRLASQDMILKYKKLKYNSNNELIGISISVKDKNGNQSNLAQKGDKPIKTISIHKDSNGALSLGNASNIPQPGTVFFKPDPNSKHAINSSENIIWISEKDGKDIDLKEGNSFVFFSDDDASTLSMGNNKKNTYTYKIKRVGGDDDLLIGSNSSNTWISKGGDSTKMKVKSGDSIVVKNNILFINTEASNNNNILYRSKSNKTPLIIIDGKESNDGKMDDIDPDTVESMIVLKGEKAIKKYGDKGKNGVIIITTKENSFIIKIDDDKINASSNKNITYRSMSNKTPLFILDGKEMKDGKIEDMDPNTIESMNVLKGEKAIKKYGEKGKDGVIEITTKK